MFVKAISEEEIRWSHLPKPRFERGGLAQLCSVHIDASSRFMAVAMRRLWVLFHSYSSAHMAEQVGCGQNQYSISSASLPVCWAESPDLTEEDHRGLPHSGHKTRKYYMQRQGEGREKDINGAVYLEEKHTVNWGDVAFVHYLILSMDLQSCCSAARSK